MLSLASAAKWFLFFNLEYYHPEAMKFNSGILLCLLLFFTGQFLCRAQGSSCENLEPFCAGSEELVFENSNPFNGGLPQAEEGPAYQCLETQPYPAWFFLQIEDDGDLSFTISQFQNADGTGAQLDVDFIIWGPFSREDPYCDYSLLTTANQIDCSYEPDAVEQMDIPNAEKDQVYVVMITNFEEEPGYISLQQNNSGEPGAGSTDCTILESALGEDRNVCGEDQIILDGTTEGARNYEWSVYNEVTEEYDVLQGQTRPTLTVTENGNYRLVVTDEFGEGAAEDDVNVTFYDEPVAASPELLKVCPADTASVDLRVLEEEIKQGNSEREDYFVEFYENEEDMGNSVPVSNPSSFSISEDRSLLARVIGEESGCASEAVEVSLEIVEFPDFLLPETSVICLNANGELQNSVQFGRNLGNYQYEWTLDGQAVSTDPVMNFSGVPQGENLVLVLTDPETACTKEVSTQLELISAPSEVQVEISGDNFSQGYQVNARALGEGNAEFEYRLDNRNWQDSGEFRDVPPGEHRVTAREKNGCGEKTSESFLLLGYPHFFSPNGDGYNDTWRISSNDQVRVKELQIFDRYGKLLKQLAPQGVWDGTYNGREMPAADYWFKLEYEDLGTGEMRKFKANFSLVR